MGFTLIVYRLPYSHLLIALDKQIMDATMIEFDQFLTVAIAHLTSSCGKNFKG